MPCARLAAAPDAPHDPGFNRVPARFDEFEPAFDLLEAERPMR